MATRPAGRVEVAQRRAVLAGAVGGILRFCRKSMSWSCGGRCGHITCHRFLKIGSGDARDCVLSKSRGDFHTMTKLSGFP